jgi:hypothetical protein
VAHGRAFLAIPGDHEIFNCGTVPIAKEVQRFRLIGVALDSYASTAGKELIRR